ncbi:hypothetical protein NDU88_006352, partial [Pleurodeles waltl]
FSLHHVHLMDLLSFLWKLEPYRSVLPRSLFLGNQSRSLFLFLYRLLLGKPSSDQALLPFHLFRALR